MELIKTSTICYLFYVFAILLSLISCRDSNNSQQRKHQISLYVREQARQQDGKQHKNIDVSELSQENCLPSKNAYWESSINICKSLFEIKDKENCNSTMFSWLESHDPKCYYPVSADTAEACIFPGYSWVEGKCTDNSSAGNEFKNKDTKQVNHCNLGKCDENKFCHKDICYNKKSEGEKNCDKPDESSFLNLPLDKTSAVKYCKSPSKCAINVVENITICTTSTTKIREENDKLYVDDDTIRKGEVKLNSPCIIDSECKKTWGPGYGITMGMVCDGNNRCQSWLPDGWNLGAWSKDECKSKEAFTFKGNLICGNKDRLTNFKINKGEKHNKYLYDNKDNVKRPDGSICGAKKLGIEINADFCASGYCQIITTDSAVGSVAKGAWNTMTNVEGGLIGLFGGKKHKKKTAKTTNKMLVNKSWDYAVCEKK